MKTAELTGAALDWAVAKAEGRRVYIGHNHTMTGPAIHDAELVDMGVDDGFVFAPSTDWSQGGPIIERECIEVGRQGGEWIACIDVPENGDWEAAGQYGPTPLVAAMRCYVASKLGDEVEIPEELR